MHKKLSAWIMAGGLIVATAASAQPEPAPTAPTEPVPDLRTRVSGSDWPRFLGPTGDGKSTEKIPGDWPLKVRWFKKVGEGYSMPSIARGRLFLFDRRGDKARLSCWRSETGEELWHSEYLSVYEDYYDYSKGPRATPLVDGDRVYTFGVEGMLRAHRVIDGELLWQVDTTAKFGVVKNFFGAGSTPVVEGELLIAQIGGSPPDSPKIHSGEVKGNGSGIVAFDKRTGAVRYSVTDTLASYASPALATIGDRRWGFAFTRGGLLGFEPATGAQDFFFPWRAKVLESVNASTPVVVGDTVFITESYGPGGALLKVKPGGYEVAWKDPRRPKSMESHWSTPIYHQGHLYGSSGQSSGEAKLRCVEHATGKVIWSEPELNRSTLLYVDGTSPQKGADDTSAQREANGALVVLTERGRLLLVRATHERFDKIAEMDLGEASDVSPKSPVDATTADRPALRFPAWNAPILAHGLLYLRGKDQLICLDAQPGA